MKLDYLALGDSYTIGTSIPALEAFPYQLAAKITEYLVNANDVNTTIIARNAWRTDDLLRGIKRSDLNEKYDLVSLLIGVNNQFDGLSIESFKMDFVKLLEVCHNKSVSTNRIFVLTIPNYGYTPYGSVKREIITSELALFNRAIKDLCMDYSVDAITSLIFH